MLALFYGGNKMKIIQQSVLAVVVLLSLNAQVKSAENLVIVSIDGLRWQEVFMGVDTAILDQQKSKDKEWVEQQFFASSPELKRQKLMPFLWQEVVKNGLIIGNRKLKSNMNVSNDMWFSYPGYNELLTGKADPNIVSNDNHPNVNITILEWLNQQAGFNNKVAAFGSWEVFPAILNRQRSALMINAGFELATWPKLTEKARWLNELQQRIPSPWHNVRFDAITVGFAREYIATAQPKVIYLALGETDDYAHQGNYIEYLKGAQRDDQLIAALWQQLQALPQYHNNTNLLITVDHGRGENPETWQHHSSPRAMNLAGYTDFEQGIVGSEQIWLAAMGPDIANKGEIAGGHDATLSQVAATALILLGMKPDDFSTDMGTPLSIASEHK